VLRPYLPLFAILMSPALTSADFAGLPQTGTRSVAYATGGIADEAPSLTLGYAYDVDASTVECPTTLFVGLRLEGVPDAPFTVHDGTLMAGMRFSLLRVATFAMPAQVGLSLTFEGSGSTVRTMLGSEASLMPGFYAEGLSLAAELTLASRWASLRVTEGNEADPFDLAGATSHRLRLGARVALVVRGKLELVGRLGYTDATEIAQGIPTYADATVGVRF
jgi:hypothetical protein